jgi:hypothetical protein
MLEPIPIVSKTSYWVAMLSSLFELPFRPKFDIETEVDARLPDAVEERCRATGLGQAFSQNGHGRQFVLALPADFASKRSILLPCGHPYRQLSVLRVVISLTSTSTLSSKLGFCNSASVKNFPNETYILCPNRTLDFVPHLLFAYSLNPPNGGA